MSVRVKNIKLLLETITHIDITETVTCIITTENGVTDGRKDGWTELNSQDPPPETEVQ